MQHRFASARFVRSPIPLVIVQTGAGDYHELTALDAFHAENKLHQFARANNLILTEYAGFPGGRSALVSESEQSSSNFCKRK